MLNPFNLLIKETSYDIKVSCIIAWNTNHLLKFKSVTKVLKDMGESTENVMRLSTFLLWTTAFITTVKLLPQKVTQTGAIKKRAVYPIHVWMDTQYTPTHAVLKISY